MGKCKEAEGVGIKGQRMKSNILGGSSVLEKRVEGGVKAKKQTDVRTCG